MFFLKEYPIYLWHLLTGRRSTFELMFAELRSADTWEYLNHVKSPDILDLGNGFLRPQFELLRNAGYRVYGIDLLNRPKHSARNFLYAIARYLYKRRFCFQMGRDKGGLVCGDVTTLPFRNESFDLITSVAALEHFLNIPEVVCELTRVLRPGGIVWAMIHLFSCPSGGHNVTLTQFPLRKMPPGVDAWDHLRLRKLPFTVPLNEWRRDQYLKSFAERLEYRNTIVLFVKGAEFVSPGF